MSKKTIGGLLMISLVTISLIFLTYDKGESQEAEPYNSETVDQLIETLKAKRLNQKELNKIKYRKIIVKDKSEINNLLNFGLDIAVEEETFAVARVTDEQKIALERDGFSIIPVQEKDFVRRLIKITNFKHNNQKELIDLLGLDIWEGSENYMLVQVYDRQIKFLKKAGINVEFIDKNLLDNKIGQ